MKALTLNELRQMVDQPVWCPKENADLKDKLDQFKAEKAVNSKYKCGGYCRVCENGYEIPSYTIGRDYGCLLNTECESFVKRKE